MPDVAIRAAGAGGSRQTADAADEPRLWVVDSAVPSCTAVPSVQCSTE